MKFALTFSDTFSVSLQNQTGRLAKHACTAEYINVSFAILTDILVHGLITVALIGSQATSACIAHPSQFKKITVRF